MTHGRRIVLLLTCLTLWMTCGLIGRAAQAQTSPPSQPVPKKTTAIPPTTTQERLVNTAGLTEPAPNGWHTDYIGQFRGEFDASFGIKFWPGHSNLRNLIFGSSIDLLPGARARVQLRRREGERQAFRLDTDEAYLELFNQYRTPNLGRGSKPAPW